MYLTVHPVSFHYNYYYYYYYYYYYFYYYYYYYYYVWQYYLLFLGAGELQRWQGPGVITIHTQSRSCK